jgi:hypothetical protein
MAHYAFFPVFDNVSTYHGTLAAFCQDFYGCSGCRQVQPPSEPYSPSEFVDQSGAEFVFNSAPMPPLKESASPHRRVLMEGSIFYVGGDGCVIQIDNVILLDPDQGGENA